MTWNQVAEVFNAKHPFYRGFCQISNLSHCRGYKRSQDTYGKRNLGKQFYIIDNQACCKGRGRSPQTSFDRFVGGNLRRNSMLSKTLSAKHGEAVADPCGKAGKCQCLKPNLTYCCGTQRTAAGHVLQKDTCDQTAVNASDEKDLVGGAIDV